jgi:hypothetical protein
VIIFICIQLLFAVFGNSEQDAHQLEQSVSSLSLGGGGWLQIK